MVKPMILSVSRRTDIPCCYPEWFMNRLRAGSVLVRNPMNHGQVSRIPLSPRTVDCIVFWTKDPAPLMPYLREVDRLGYRYYFQFTLTSYGRELERNLRDKTEIEKTFLALAQAIGKERVLWRYDPVVLTDEVDIKYHEREFERLCKTLCGHTPRVTVSFVDLYAKLKKTDIRSPNSEEAQALAALMGERAKAYGLQIFACAEKADMSRFGILPSSCIDQTVLESICSAPLDITKDKGQRPECGCVESVDIGRYHTCRNSCVYCYAGNAKMEMQNADSEMLCDALTGREKITERQMRSLLTAQTTLF